MEREVKGGYWFPYLNSGPNVGHVPWSPAHRDEAGNIDQMISVYFQTAGQVMRYLGQKNLTPAWTGNTADLCRHQEIRRRCAVCTAPDHPDRPQTFSEYKISLAGARAMAAHGQTSTESEIEKIMDQAKREARDDGPPDDDRFDWVETRSFADARSTWTRGACYHRTPTPVDLRTGQLVAWWCKDCGQQFEWDHWPVPSHLWVPLPEVDRSRIKGVEVVVPSGFEQKFREAMNLGGATPVTVMTNHRRQPAPVRAFLTTWNGIKTSVIVGWPLYAWLIYAVLTIMNGVK